MVYFVCESCNESLKKAQVERHRYSCRNSWRVTCVDCNFTFEGDSFQTHTSCLSEDQKYQGALYKAPKGKQQKNRGVNEIWADAVKRAATNASQGIAPKALSFHLLRMGDLGNVPRQEKKFKNFIKNSLRVFDDAGVSKLWDYLDGVREEVFREEQEAKSKEEKDKKKATAPNTNPAGNTSGNTDDVVGKTPRGKPKKGRGKRAREENTTQPSRGDAMDSRERAKCNGGKRRVVGDCQEHSVTAVVIEANPEGGIAAVDTPTRKALIRAAIGILKKAPEKNLAVKELVKQAVVSAKENRGVTGESDRKELKRALRQRLKNCAKIEIRGDVAVYCKGSPRDD